ncbi:MAG: phosphate ABC transporter permease subunit PstC [Dehalococcoidia bacterium]|nr:phosphate ABC transporter permease subunit PstC [Dehalococcoidia bacterium]
MTLGRRGLGQRRLLRMREAPVLAVLFLCALASVLTTVGIVVVLLDESVGFFRQVSIVEFLTERQWTPLFVEKHFGVLPLLSATFLIALLALAVAVPVGLGAAIYLSEYASARVRGVLKPVLEVLAGIPTVVYGYFALTFIAPQILQPLGQETVFSALSAALAMSIMLLPFVSSLSEDAMRAVPASLREAGYALGSSRLEVAVRVVLPAALSGVMAAVVLALARAVGETMIVTIAAGNMPNLSWNPLEAMQALPAYIVQVSLGDTPAGTLEYKTIFAVGLALFACTLVLNVAAQWLMARFREVYE